MILSVNDIHKSYGKEGVLKGISFEIKHPQIIALVGPNGSGKTTLMNIITNLLKADRGYIKILNKTNEEPQMFKEVSFLQDNSVLYDYLTGYDHLQFICDIQGIEKKQLAQTAERIGMTHYLNKKVGNYSLGMKQHLLLTMAIINKPKLLILDEPLNGLDPTSAIKVRELLLETFNKGATILLSSHNLAEIDRVTSNILFLKKGQLIAEDIPHHKTTFYEITVDNVRKAQKTFKNITVPITFSGDRLKIYDKDMPINKVLRLLAQAEITILDIDRKVFSSEERYQKIFGETVKQNETS